MPITTKKEQKAVNRVLCLTPTKGKAGTQIEKWKYDAVRRALRQVVPKSRNGIEFSEVPYLVGEALKPVEKAKLGSIVWYTVTVKLHLEVLGELERVPKFKPQRLRRVR